MNPTLCSAPVVLLEFFYSRDMFLSAIPLLNESTKPLTIADLHLIRSTFLDRWFGNKLVSSSFLTALFRLDRASALHPASRTLADFRADENLVETDFNIPSRKNHGRDDRVCKRHWADR